VDTLLDPPQGMDDHMQYYVPELRPIGKAALSLVKLLHENGSFSWITRVQVLNKATKDRSQRIVKYNAEGKIT
jgi:hypothetical protein